MVVLNIVRYMRITVCTRTCIIIPTDATTFAGPIEEEFETIPCLDFILPTLSAVLYIAGLCPSLTRIVIAYTLNRF